MPARTRWVYRSPGWAAGLLSLILAAGLALGLSRTLPPPLLSLTQPVLEAPDVAAAIAGPPASESQVVPGQGPGAGEYILVTAEPGPAAALLPALARALAAQDPRRSLLLSVSAPVQAPGPVVLHVHLSYRVEGRAAVTVKPAGAYPPLWLRQLANAAVTREAGPAPEGWAVQLRELLLVADPAPGTLSRIALEGTGPDALDLAAFGRAVERLLHSVDELPVIPRPDAAGIGRSSTLYLVLGSRYVTAPGLWLAQLAAFFPLSLALGRGLRRVRRPWRWLADEAAVLAAVQAYRFDQGRLPPTPGQTRAQRRRRRLQGAWRPLVTEGSWWAIWLGCALAAGAGWYREVWPAVAGLALAGVGWLTRRAGGEQSPEDRRWALLALLAASVVTSALLTRGSPIVLVAFYPAALFWPRLIPGRQVLNLAWACLGLAGPAWLLAGSCRPAPWPVAFALLLAVTLAGGALRLALEPAPGAGAGLE
ncbi:MAG: hypothetical protein RDU89_10205 [bacterium]|nr:hypothetical protein [bacterium]